MNGKALAVIIAAIVLVVAGVVGAAVALTTGDDDDDKANDDNDSSDTGGEISVEEFCEPFQTYMDSFLDVDITAPEEEQVQTLVGAIKDYAAALDDLGTPEGMPDDAREGKEVLVDWAEDLDLDHFTSIEDFENFEDEFSDDENAAGEAFFAYAEKTCSGAPTDLPTDIPSDLPTDLPTEFPSDFPTELPSDFLSNIPSDYLTMLPSDFLSDIPSEYLTMIPSEFLTMFPTE